MTKKDRTQLFITVILVAVFIFFLKQVFKGKGNTPLTGAQLENTFLLKEENAENLFSRLQAETMNLQLKRDPFSLQPLIPSSESSTSLILTGIFWDEKTPRAIINNMIVEKGSKILGNIVVEVKEDKVILSDGSKLFELGL